MSMTNTPAANRLHIGIFGRRNSGKSTLINAIAGQNVAVTSNVAGTTTDPVYKAIELRGIGPCMLIDTAGFDDDAGELGELRVEKAREVLAKTDVGIVVFCDSDVSVETEWIEHLRESGRPIIAVVNKSDVLDNLSEISKAVHDAFKLFPIVVSAREGLGISNIIDAVVRCLPEDYEKENILGNLIKPGNLVVLVMPQDKGAPKGRLILPQVQVLRELLDRHCLSVCIAPEELTQTLATLGRTPDLIITDSQAFSTVYAQKPKNVRLTSFSILMAMNKGDIAALVDGANAIDTLTANSRVLIAEACAHAPVDEDIGRVKLPAMLRRKIGEALQVDVVAGADFPENLAQYDLIIHCGACMFNRRYMLSRIQQAQVQHVPLTNYGVALAKLTGILQNISYE